MRTFGATIPIERGSNPIAEGAVISSGLRRCVGVAGCVGEASFSVEGRKPLIGTASAVCSGEVAARGSYKVGIPAPAVGEGWASKGQVSGGSGVSLADVLSYLESNDVVGKDWIGTRSGEIEREAGSISQIIKVGGRTITLTKDGQGRLSSISDGARTRTLQRDGQGAIVGWTVE